MIRMRQNGRLITFKDSKTKARSVRGVGPGPEPPRIVPSRYEPLEPEETPRYWQKFSGDKHLTIHGVPPPGRFGLPMR